MSKVTEVTQGQMESPTAFLERLMETYRLWTPIDPEAPENRRAVNLAFVAQSAPDIRKKLQKLDGFEGKNLSELVEIALKIYNNRDNTEIRQLRQVSKVMAAVLNDRPNDRKRSGFQPKRETRTPGPRVPLKKDQCAYCKKEGHWKNKCPDLVTKKEQSPAAPKILEIDSD